MTGTWTADPFLLGIGVASLICSFTLSEIAYNTLRRSRQRLLGVLSLCVGIPGGVVLFHVVQYGLRW